MMTHIRHGKIELALHALAPARDHRVQPLLLLHGLGERTPPYVPEPMDGWPGPVYGLDFTGHGASDSAPGGGYTAEVMMADADAALGHLGTATVCGRGLGAYVALLLAGGRARGVLGAILCDGPGLAGGGGEPSSPRVVHPDPHAIGPPDPFALVELSSDLRPPDYAMSYVRQAAHLGPLERSLFVCARHRPSWLAAVAKATEAECETLEEALDLCAQAGRAFLDHESNEPAAH